MVRFNGHWSLEQALRFDLNISKYQISCMLLVAIYQNHTQSNISKLQGIGYNSMRTTVYQGVEKYCQ